MNPTRKSLAARGHLGTLEMAETPEWAQGRSRDGWGRGWGRPSPLPFQFQIPLGGGPLGIALPIGGGPFALTVPLGGAPPAAATPALPASAPPTPAQASAPGLPEPVAVAAPDPIALAGTPDSFGERLAVAHAALGARAGVLPHSAAAFDGLAAELDHDDPGAGLPLTRLSATRLFRWLARDGGERFAQRIERALPQGRLLVLALPNAPTTGLALRPGDLLVRAARGQGFGWVSVVAAPDLAGADQLAALGWRGEGDPTPPPGRYVRVMEFGPWSTPDPRPLARRVANGAGLAPPDTLLLRVLSLESAGEAQAEVGARPEPWTRRPWTGSPP